MSGCHQLAKQITWEENKGEWGLFLALYRFRGGTIDLHPNYLRNTVGSARFGHTERMDLVCIGPWFAHRCSHCDEFLIGDSDSLFVRLRS